MTKNIFRFLLLTSLFLAALGGATQSVQADLDDWADLGEVAPGQYGAVTLASSASGYIFGGTAGPAGMPYIFAYDTVTSQSSGLISVPGTGADSSRVTAGPDGRFYVATSGSYNQGNLAVYDPATGIVTNLGSIGDEYAHGLIVSSDNKVYVSTCCQGKLSIYDLQTNTWNYRGQIISTQRRLTGLVEAGDGYIYGVTSRIWVSPPGDASLFRYNPATQTTTVIGTIVAGTHEAWAIAFNPVDGKLYMAVGYNMFPHLYVYDPATPANGIQDLGQISATTDNIVAGGIAISSDGKVYGFVQNANHMIVYDPFNPTLGIVDLGLSNGGSPLVFGADQKLYAMSGTHLLRSNQINPEVTYVVEGIVRDDNDQPVAGVQIVTDQGDAAVTDVNGRYRFVGLAAGDYSLTPGKAGFRFAPQSASLSVPEDTGRNFYIRPEVPTAFLDLPLDYSSVIGSTQQQRFVLASNGSNRGEGPGFVNSWFDHSVPLYGPPNYILARWDGAYFHTSDRIDLENCDTPPGGLGITCYDNHNGIDFRHTIPYGELQPVYAAGSGKVVASPRINVYGNEVLIDHHNGYATYYGHLYSTGVTIGEDVMAGTQIGIMGETGNSKGVHLHFGVYYDLNGDHIWTESEVVDPYGWRPQNQGQVDPWSIPSHYLWMYSNLQQAEVTTTGGTYSSASGMLTCTVPPAAVSSNLFLEISDTPLTRDASAQLRPVGSNFLIRLIPGGNYPLTGEATTPIGAFDAPVTMDFSYGDQAFLAHLNENLIKIFRWDEGTAGWTELPSLGNTETNLVSTQTSATGLFGLQAPLICPADSSEPNDSPDAARSIQINAEPLSAILDIAGDVDWYQIDLAGGDAYTLHVVGLDSTVNPTITLMPMTLDGEFWAVTAEDGTAERKWTAPADGGYYLRVTGPQTGTGCQASYQIWLEVEKKLYIPLVTR